MKDRILLALGLALFIAHPNVRAETPGFFSTTIAVGNEDSGPDAVATADVNGDGWLDLIVANYGFRWGLPGDPGGWNTNLVVLTNAGSGTLVFSRSLTVGRGPTSVAAADINGDGRADLISANETDNSLTVLTNGGGGSFSLSETLPVGTRPHGLVVADVDDNGWRDLMCVNSGANSIAVLTNNGAGNFGLRATLPTGNEPLALVASDVNADGSLDLICANKDSDSLTVLTNAGSGNFVLCATLAVGHFPDWVSAADFNGDGQPDLVSVNWGAASMTVLTNLGGGNFNLKTTLIVGSHPSSVAPADFNGDGATDLICANTDANSLSVFTNDSTGAFASAGTLSTGRIPNVSPVDFNGDGKPDLACLNFRDGTVTILLNTTPFPLQWTTENLPPGCIAWWQAEGDMLDSASSHDGTGSTTPTYGPGRFGQAFRFDGTNQSVMIPDGHADLDGWTQFTLEAWVNFDSLRDSPGPGQCVISKVGNHRGPYSGNFGYQFGFGYTATKLFCQFNADNVLWPGYQTIVDVPFALSTNVWYHVAATYDHNAVKLYLNGLPLVTNVVGPVTIANTVATLRISSDDNYNVAFAGRIDDTRIYNRALSGREIAYVYSGIPWLNIAYSNQIIIVSWKAPGDGWVLERTNTLPNTAAAWPQVPPPYQTNAGTTAVTFTNLSTIGTQFFRLHKP